jgi:hypothetical protein
MHNTNGCACAHPQEAPISSSRTGGGKPARADSVYGELPPRDPQEDDDCFDRLDETVCGAVSLIATMHLYDDDCF